MDEAPHTVEIDEAFLAEWCLFGFVEMGAYLRKYAAFTTWCAVHERQEQQDGEPRLEQPQR